jgi:hypothetical protein
MASPYGPYNQAFAISKSDTVNIAQYTNVAQGRGRLTDAVYVGGAGVVPAVFEDDSVCNFTAVAGEILPIAIKRVNDANCTASVMVALYRN